MSYNIFDEISRMHERMDRLFDQMMQGSPSNLLENRMDDRDRALTSYDGKTRFPLGDVTETESKVIASFEMPGIDKKDIKLDIKDNMLEIKASKKEKKSDKSDDGSTYFESSRSFYRKVPLPAEIDVDKVKAKFENGLLKIDMPKIEPKNDDTKYIDIE